MLFNSWTFAVFLALFTPLYAIARHNVSARNALLLVGSYVFYGWWDSRFLILVAISTAVDYCAALGAAGHRVSWGGRLKGGGFMIATAAASLAFAPCDLWIAPAVGLGLLALAVVSELVERAEPAARRALWLAVSLVINLGILIFFKYFNFFIDSLVGAVTLLGAKIDFFTLKIVLPVGLSFYTFQAISRTIDSYRGQFAPQHSLLNYAAYHAFFPQLVAGPIERAAHLMPQFERVQLITTRMISSGALLFLWGVYKKVVVADNVAPLADAVFRGGGDHSAAEVVVAILAFTIQIYGDFSGYSDMARGLARALGFDLMVNFNLPYFARSPQEFWRRWHISLSTWLRDYLYIPLGGSRGGEGRVAWNLMVTMILGGLWHGAAWTFVIWGAFHGAIQVAYRALGVDRALARVPPRRPLGMALHVGSWALTMVLVMVGWVFFRAPTLGAALAVLGGALGTNGYSVPAFQTLMFYVLPLIAVELYQRFSGITEFMATGPSIVRYHAVLMVALAVVVLGASGGKQFIYFDF